MKYCLMIVDDEKICRKSLANLLQRELPEVEVLQASNGLEALESMQSQTVHAMFLDIRMPKMDGLELLQEMERRSMAPIPTVIVSGYDDFDYARTAMQHHASDYLLKPITPREAMEAVRKLLKDLEEDQRAQQLQSHVEEIKDLLLTDRPEERVMEHLRDMLGEEDREETGVSRITELARRYVEAHYTENLSNSSLAAALGYSPNYLAQTFKNEIGMGINEYLRDVRLRHARELLRQTNCRVSEIAATVGFSSNQYFTTVFRRSMGMTPVEYRDQRQDLEKVQ